MTLDPAVVPAVERASGNGATPSRPTAPVVVALVAAPAVSAATLFGFHDLLSGVRRDWALLHQADPGNAEGTASPFLPLIVSRDGQPLMVANDVTVVPQASFATCPTPAVVCITDLLVAPDDDLGDRYDAEVRWLRDCHEQGALLASACSGALLLARTGLLTGGQATSHWAYCRALSRRYPAVHWAPERGLVNAGPDGRLLMAGSGIAWHMLALALIARFAGAEDAMRVARINLIDGPEVSPLAYASLTHGRRSQDAVIERCQRWAADHYDQASPVTQMVVLAGLAERTFKRRFALATGQSPIEYIHTLRLEEAKHLLEATMLPVETIASQVGYQDPSFFGRLFRRRVAMTPADYRRRFGGLKRRLERAGSDSFGDALADTAGSETGEADLSGQVGLDGALGANPTADLAVADGNRGTAGVGAPASDDPASDDPPTAPQQFNPPGGGGPRSP